MTRSQFKESKQSNNHSKMSNNGVKKFSQTEEEEGCRKIVEALTEEELKAMPDENMPRRHFRADKGDITKAIKRIKYAISWRKEFDVNKLIRAAHNPSNDEEEELRSILKHESSPGKMYVRNHDNEGRAILYMYPVKENSRHPENNIMHLVYQLERAIANSEKNGHEKVVIIMDYLDWKMKHASPMSIAKQTIHILQECYVERMARAYMTNAPLMFRTFWNMVKPFLDPYTVQKIVFCTSEAGQEELRKNFDLKKVEKCALGTEELKVFDVEDYYNTPLNTTFDEQG